MELQRLRSAVRRDHVAITARRSRIWQTQRGGNGWAQRTGLSSSILIPTTFAHRLAANRHSTRDEQMRCCMIDVCTSYQMHGNGVERNLFPTPAAKATAQIFFPRYLHNNFPKCHLSSCFSERVCSLALFFSAAYTGPDLSIPLLNRIISGRHNAVFRISYVVSLLDDGKASRL